MDGAQELFTLQMRRNFFIIPFVNHLIMKYLKQKKEKKIKLKNYLKMK
jgi:antibiotic biosynthesis monooxygenase (ABM) superfamily enzyme